MASNDILTNAALTFGIAPSNESEGDEDEGAGPLSMMEPPRPRLHVPPGGFPAAPQTQPHQQRTSPTDELQVLIESGTLDARDAAYLRVLQSLARPREALPYDGDVDGNTMETGMADDAGRRCGIRSFTELDQIAYEANTWMPG